jgi:hypothetical protein
MLVAYSFYGFLSHTFPQDDQPEYQSASWTKNWIPRKLGVCIVPDSSAAGGSGVACPNPCAGRAHSFGTSNRYFQFSWDTARRSRGSPPSSPLRRKIACHRRENAGCSVRVLWRHGVKTFPGRAADCVSVVEVSSGNAGVDQTLLTTAATPNAVALHRLNVPRRVISCC